MNDLLRVTVDQRLAQAPTVLTKKFKFNREDSADKVVDTLTDYLRRGIDLGIVLDYRFMQEIDEETFAPLITVVMTTKQHTFKDETQ